jgi:cellulose synthase/poly-beta-1,6-N-acetylglucosamine synthase-like glycosyltransferase
MTASQTVLATVCCLCAALVVYAYLGYPVVIYALARLLGRRPPVAEPADDELPKVSLLIAAYNEEAVIEDRIRNALDMDYPADRWEVVVATDGCSDRTAEIVRRFAHRGVRLLENHQRRGKAATLNDAFGQVSGEVVILSDANTFTDPSAARHLVRWFEDSRVVTVCGKLVLTDPETGQNVDGMYWKYETFLKRQEGRLGALLGANGGIYAIRKSQYVPIPNGTILDDLVIPLLAKLRHGGDIVFDRRAVAHEETPANITAEFHRRSRLGAGGFGTVGLLAGLLNPCRGWIFFTFVSHKLLRWCCPFFLLGLLATSAQLYDLPLFRALLFAQIAFYATAVVAAYLPGQFKALRLLRLATMFASMNGALLVGFARWLFNTQNVTWRRTARLAEAGQAAVAVGPRLHEEMPEELGIGRPGFGSLPSGHGVSVSDTAA